MRCYCNEVQCIYSKDEAGSKYGSTKAKLECLEHSLKNEGVCIRHEGDWRWKEIIFTLSSLLGDEIKSDSYNPPKGTKGGRIVTDNICSVCYLGRDLLTPNEIKRL